MICFVFVIGLEETLKSIEQLMVTLPAMEKHCHFLILKHYKSDPSFEDTSSTKSRSPYVDTIHQIQLLRITHSVPGTVLGAVDTIIYKKDIVSILMQILFRKSLCRSPLYLHKR